VAAEVCGDGVMAAGLDAAREDAICSLSDATSRPSAGTWPESCCENNPRGLGIWADGIREVNDLSPDDVDGLLASLAGVEQLGVLKLTLDDLPGEADRRAGTARTFARAISRLDAFAQRLGVTAPFSASNLHTLATAGGLIERLPSAAAQGFDPMWAVPENGHIITGCWKRFVEMDDHRRRVRTAFSGSGAVRPEEIRRHAAAIGRAGFLGFLSGSVRAAKRFYQEHSVLSVLPGKTEMAASLLDMADFLDTQRAAKQDFTFTSAIKQIGARNLELAACIADWACLVRAGFAEASNDYSALAADVLLAGDSIEPATMSWRDTRSACMWLAAYFRGRAGCEVVLGEEAARLESEASQVAVILRECNMAGLPPRISLSELRSAVALVRSRHLALEPTNAAGKLVAGAFGQEQDSGEDRLPAEPSSLGSPPAAGEGLADIPGSPTAQLSVTDWDAAPSGMTAPPEAAAADATTRSGGQDASDGEGPLDSPSSKLPEGNAADGAASVGQDTRAEASGDVNGITTKTHAWRISVAEARVRLNEFREREIALEFPGCPDAECLLRSEMVEILLARLPSDQDEFRRMVPEPMRSSTHGKQMRFFDAVLDILARVVPERSPGAQEAMAHAAVNPGGYGGGLAPGGKTPKQVRPRQRRPVGRPG